MIAIVGSANVDGCGNEYSVEISCDTIKIKEIGKSELFDWSGGHMCGNR